MVVALGVHRSQGKSELLRGKAIGSERPRLCPSPAGLFGPLYHYRGESRNPEPREGANIARQMIPLAFGIQLCTSD